ncbi:MAG: hypothetical protein ACR2OA_21985 [Rubripirellula sp.]|jgi:hypothetical protein
MTLTCWRPQFSNDQLDWQGSKADLEEGVASANKIDAYPHLDNV